MSLAAKPSLYAGGLLPVVKFGYISYPDPLKALLLPSVSRCWWLAGYGKGVLPNRHHGS